MSSTTATQGVTQTAARERWADPSALGNLTLGLLIGCLLPLLYGAVDPGAIVAAVPWVLTSFPLLILVVVVQLRDGDLLGATANGILGVVLLGQNFVQGLLAAGQAMTGSAMSERASQGAAAVNGAGYIAAGLLLLVVGYLVGRLTSWGAVSMWAAGAGFLSLAGRSFGLPAVFEMVGAIGITVVGAWFFYSGLAMLVNGVLGRPIIPLGRPFHAGR